MDKLEREKNMMPFTKCSICGTKLETKEVDKIVRVGKHTAFKCISLSLFALWQI
jgi:hypothetical protein